MQDENRELTNLSPEAVARAIEALKARAWDVNPFTVADELQVSRTAISEHAEIMKIIIAARGSFDLNVQIKEELVTKSQYELHILSESIEEVAANVALNEDKETDKEREVIFNLANDNPRMYSYFNQLSWKDIETVYNFQVSSLKERARNLFNANAPFSIPYFVRLKSQSFGPSQVQEDFGSLQESRNRTSDDVQLEEVLISPLEISKQPNLVEETFPKSEDRIVADIKLITLLKDQPVQASSNVDLIIDHTDSSVPRDELRDLIQNHIRNAVEQMAEFPPGYSISTGKEFEVWLNNPARSKFVGSTKASEANSAQEEEVRSQSKQLPFKPRVVPPDIRKACLILGLRPDNITYEVVQEAWKKAIVAPGVHPDLGGDTELAAYLNTAKDVLMRFLDARAPKLGKKFGPFKTEKDGKTNAEKPKGE